MWSYTHDVYHSLILCIVQPASDSALALSPMQLHWHLAYFWKIKKFETDTSQVPLQWVQETPGLYKSTYHAQKGQWLGEEMYGSKKWRVPDQEVNQRGLEERLCKK